MSDPSPGAVQLALMLERAAQIVPRRIGISDGERSFRYADLALRTARLASWLERIGARAGAGTGTRVAILDANSIGFVETYFACARTGAVLCPLNTRSSARELAAVLADSGARVLLAGPAFERQVAAVIEAGADVETLLWLGERPAGARGAGYDEALSFAPSPTIAAVGPATVAQLYYTSGTTGRPKGVMLTHGNVATHALAAIGELGLSGADVWAHVAPMFHLADAWAVFAITWVGGEHVVVPRFDESAVLDAFEARRVTITNLIPTMLHRLVRHPGAERRDLTSLRRILSGGAPIAPETVREIVRVFRCEYVQTYGMTETSPYLTLSLLHEHLTRLPEAEQLAYRAKTGRPFLAVELEVIGDDGLPVPHDAKTVGEIRARGPTVTPGYWNRPEETAAAFENGWLKTGDLAHVDAEGYLQIVDRRKDVIITGGEKVYSTEIEHVLYEHPAVLEAAVFGIPDPEWGESIRAAVALRAGSQTSERDLLDFCRSRLAPYKVPRSVEFHPELPKTGSAKISKRALRDPHWSSTGRRI
jgi:fatty-acyl-CoA synthase